MASSESQQHTLPAVPPSLSAGDHEMRDYYAGQDVPRPTINQSPYLTPYLGLQARLSQVWINRWTILLLLVLVRVLIACASLDDNLGSARREALSACTNVETMGSAMASMPHYMSKGVNELAADGIDKAVNGLMSMVSLTITGVEEIVLFIINLLTSTYVCLFTFAVGGSLHAALDVVSEVSKFLNKALGDIGDDIAGVVSDFQKGYNDFINAINLPLIGDDPPELHVTQQINKLKHLSLPSGLNQGLETLNDSIPNFKQVHHFTDHVIRLPFEKLKDLVDDEMGTYHFDRNALHVPPRKQLTFCSDDNGINDFFDGLVDTEHTARKVFIGVVVVLAVLACLPMAWWEIKRWRTMQERAKLVNQQAFDPMDVVYIASRPHTASVGIKLADRFQSVRHRTLIRWMIAYATSTPALFVLSLGVAGLFACLCQYILLRSIEAEVPELSSQVSDFAQKVVWELNNASEAWAVGTNHQIHQANADINDKLFGWVETSTTSVNDTLNTFVHEMHKAIDDVFGGTVLEEPVQEVIHCLIGIKIRGIEKGLTWVHDHAHVNVPPLPKDVFSLGAIASIHNESATDSFLASPSSAASDEITAITDRLVDLMADGIRQEAIISLCVVLVWVIIVIVGFFRTVILMGKPGRSRAEGGQVYADDPATNQARGLDIGRPMSVAPPYSAAPYTLTPRPFPNPADSNEEQKISNVNAHNTGSSVIRPAHTRASSHGALAGPAEKSAADFPIDSKH